MIDTATVMARIRSAPTTEGKVDALVKALDWGRSIPGDTEGARLTRDRRIFAVAAVGQLLEAMGRGDLAVEFRALASTLSDLNVGIGRKTLKREPRRGGPEPQHSDVWRGRAYVAAAVDILLRASQLKAIKDKINKHEQRLWPLLDDRQMRDLAGAAAGWRDQFNAGTVKNFEATNAYITCKGLVADDIDALAEALLRLAAEMAEEVSRDSR
jgi:hypothetical protein